MSWWKFGFGILGLASLSLILKDYGFYSIYQDLLHVGWRFLPLCLTFVPTLLCYALVWYLVTEKPKDKPFRYNVWFFFQLFKITIIAIAWNNLSPFIKIFGEPVRLVELNRIVSDRRAAIGSVLIFNLTHTMGTILSFVVAAIAIPLLFPVSVELQQLLTISIFGFVSILLAFWILPWLLQHGLKLPFFRKVHRIAIWLRWIVRKINQFYARKKMALVLALFFSVTARFIEGLTFYYAFRILGEPLHFITAAFLDVGRALADNAFFFVPYQLGSREYAVGFLLEHVFLIGGKVFVGAALLYRLVEIFWMLVGYIWWGFRKKNAPQP